MKARRDFLNDSEYAEYLKTYATIQAMTGLLANGEMYNGKKDSVELSRDAERIANSLLHRIYIPEEK